jgi:methylthioribose-1-phosphate isomerase
MELGHSYYELKKYINNLSIDEAHKTVIRSLAYDIAQEHCELSMKMGENRLERFKSTIS